LYASQKSAPLEFYAEYGIEPGTLQSGALLGTVEVVACTGAPGDDYQWHLANPQRLAAPIKPDNRPNPVWFKPFDDDTIG
jgi:hypothetical protein